VEEVGVQRVHAYPQKFQYVENPGKILENPVKICANLVKPVKTFDKSLKIWAKMAPNEV